MKEDVGHRKSLSFIDEWRIKSMYNCRTCGRSIFLNKRLVLTADDIAFGEENCEFGVIVSDGIKIKVKLLEEISDGWIEIYAPCLQTHNFIRESFCKHD